VCVFVCFCVCLWDTVNPTTTANGTNLKWQQLLDARKPFSLSRDSSHPSFSSSLCPSMKEMATVAVRARGCYPPAGCAKERGIIA